MNKKIVLKSIKLQNWSSINSVVEFCEGRTIIKGMNKVGKSSIMNAWRWLLTSRVDAIHPANYKLFDKRFPLTPETPEAIVEAIVEINGCEFILTRKAKAAFVKGEKAPSDKYTTLIDKVEYTATQFNEWLEANIAPVAMLPFCIDGIFFATLCEEDKKKGRKVLEAIVGEITQDDFVGDYSLIVGLLAKLPIEKVLEKTKAEIAELDKSAVRLPIEIEAKENIVASWTTNGDIEAEIESKKKRIAELDEIINKGNDPAIVAKRNEIFAEMSKRELRLEERRNSYNAQHVAEVNRVKSLIKASDESNRAIAERNNSARMEFERAEKSLKLEKITLDNLNSRLNTLRQRRDEIKARVFSDDKCVYCGQELPDDKLNEAKERFAKQKNDDLAFVVADGKNTATQIADCEARIAKLEEIIARGYNVESEVSVDALHEELASIESSFKPYNTTDEYAALKKDIDDIKATLPETIDFTPIIAEKASVTKELQELLEKNGSKSQYNALLSDIEALRGQLREIGNEKAYKLGVKAKCEEWIEERASIISNRVNGKLTTCSIQMFSIQKNGEQVPDCVILDSNGVEYGKTNTAERLSINIELQRMFLLHFGIELPIFVDECSIFSPSNVPSLSQQHVLIFATDDKILKVEHR
jgi:chromosome segregation ATPase